MPPLLLLTMPTLDCIYRQHDKKVMHSSHLASASMSYSRPALMTADLAKQQMRIQMASAILLKARMAPTAVCLPVLLHRAKDSLTMLHNSTDWTAMTALTSLDSDS